MPLYTYIVTYKGATHVAQGSHSNYRGFISSWCANIPVGALPALTPALHKELASKAYRSDFVAVSNIKHTWKKVIDLGGIECTVVAVQTQQ